MDENGVYKCCKDKLVCIDINPVETEIRLMQSLTVFSFPFILLFLLDQLMSLFVADHEEPANVSLLRSPVSQWEEAVADAHKAIELDPSLTKVYLRKELLV